MNLAPTIVPKSDQLNADDLIGRTLTITITGVRGCDDRDQPVAIHFEGDGGKPYKPCKSMRRVMVHAWGVDGNAYAGRRMTLYRDENVQFGGIKVGGIRISHMSDIERELAMALTVTRAQRRPYSVKPLPGKPRAVPPPSPRQAPPEEETSRYDRPQPEADGYEDGGGFGSSQDADPVSDALAWGRQLQEDLEADAFRSVAELDGVCNRPDNVEMFQALSAENPDYAKRLNAMIVGRRKAMLSRERR